MRGKEEERIRYDDRRCCLESVFCCFCLFLVHSLLCLIDQLID